VAPARSLGDRAGFAVGVIEIAKAGIGIGLKDPGVAGEMPVRVLAVEVARVEEQRCGRVRAGDTARAATSDELKQLRREASALKEVVAELTLENRLLKKSVIGVGENGA
jgi:hypothetical protein